MSFFDSLTPVSQYQAQAVAKEGAPRPAIPAMPTPQTNAGFAYYYLLPLWPLAVILLALFLNRLNKYLLVVFLLFYFVF